MINWPTHFDFTNLEELRIDARIDDSIPRSAHPFLQSVTSPCLRRVILEVYGERGIEDIRWPFLDEGLVNLVEKHKAYRSPVLQVSTAVDPEKIRGLLPRAAQEGILEVRFSEHPDYCA